MAKIQAPPAPPYPMPLIDGALREGKVEDLAQLSDSIRGELEARQRRVAAKQEQEERWKREPASSGEKPIALGGTVVQANFLYRLVKACQVFKLPPPQELVLALQVLLQQDRFPGRHEKKQTARLKAIEYLATHPTASAHEVGRAVGVAHTTVLRWKL